MKEEIVEMISKDAAIQRSGRTGRINHGVCYRIYTEEQFINMNDYRTPEIKQINFSHMLLKLLYFGINDITRIQLIEQPSNKEIMIALNDLKKISAIREENKPERDSESYFDNKEYGLYEITKFGKWLYDLQIDPFYGKILYNTIKKNRFGLKIIVKIISVLIANDYLFFSFKKKHQSCPFKEELTNNSVCFNDLENDYIAILSKKLVSEVIASNEEEELIRKQQDDLLMEQKVSVISLENKYMEISNQIHQYQYYNKLFEILDPYFNKDSYFIKNKILSLGDLTVNLFYYRQIDFIRCQKHFDEILNKFSDPRDCKYCQIILTYYLFFYGYNSKNFIICENNYTNLVSLLTKSHYHYINEEYFNIEIIRREKELAFWTRIYVYLHRKDYQSLLSIIISLTRL
jgi:hypothetical protein